MTKTYELIQQVWNENENTLINVLCRYHDEHDYEPKSEYIKFITNKLSKYGGSLYVNIKPNQLVIGLVKFEEEQREGVIHLKIGKKDTLFVGTGDIGVSKTLK